MQYNIPTFEDRTPGLMLVIGQLLCSYHPGTRDSKPVSDFPMTLPREHTEDPDQLCAVLFAAW
jgi:hypothetical protein